MAAIIREAKRGEGRRSYGASIRLQLAAHFLLERNGLQAFASDTAVIKLTQGRKCIQTRFRDTQCPAGYRFNFTTNVFFANQ